MLFAFYRARKDIMISNTKPSAYYTRNTAKLHKTLREICFYNYSSGYYVDIGIKWLLKVLVKLGKWIGF